MVHFRCSGGGQHIAYEYAKKGARLVLVARREQLLQEVADKAMTKGAFDVQVIAGDVAHEQQCKRIVDETIAKYGRCKIFCFFFLFLHKSGQRY